MFSITKALSQEGNSVSPNAFILKAAGLALKESPLTSEDIKNSSLFINIVGSTPRGQFVPVENSQSKGIEKLSQDIQVVVYFIKFFTF